MVEFLLGIVVGVIITIVFLHYYGKHLYFKSESEMGEFIQEHTKANDYAIS
jgi:hypothetical protein